MVAPAGVGDSASMTPNPISTVSARNVVPFGGDRRASRGPEPQPKAVSVLIAHGERLARAGLRFLIDGDDALAVAGEAATGEHAVALARRRLPDIVVIDLSLPGLDAVEATRQIVADPALSRVRVLVLTPADSSESILGPLRAGAGGLIVSDGEPAELLRAMRLLAAGEAPVSPSLMGTVIADVASRPQPPQSDGARLGELTEREREIVALVALGLNNREIAQQLVISPATSRTHVSRAMRKLDARDRAQLVVFAYQTGLATPGATALPTPAAPPRAAHPPAAPGRRDRFGVSVSPVRPAAMARGADRAVRIDRRRALMRVGA